MAEEDKVALKIHDVAGALLDDWRMLFDQLVARFKTGDFDTGARLVAEIAKAADKENHHPDVDLRYGYVEVRLSSHDVGAVTQRDVRLARTITDLAGSLGAKPDTLSVQTVEWALDTWDASEIKPFWAAVLGLEPDDDDTPGHEATDAGGRWPSVWFQESERNQAGPQRWHADVRVPPDVAQARVRRAVDAGGTLVNDGYAPRFWVLADAQGNRACITTGLGRDQPDDPHAEYPETDGQDDHDA
ncbi:4a-hydroxytetrahydrobiopterin dehydratase [Nocardioides sp. CBS4Y-1]|uniref:Putative pterin-4-alpha-carbinolamine dehydratase n=2 Tax=Nocardioides acrostichi TaxID=2784339 RepID=A0A930UT50_9ACTN|nr:4a-hydroxytetrahydrobiopterin dehydratase [Nocardioides acrostichi]